MQSSLLVLICLLSWCGLGACRSCHEKAKLTENGFHMRLLLRFLVLEVYRFVFLREVLPFSIWFYPPLLDYDVFLYIFVELIVMIPTSLPCLGSRTPRVKDTPFLGSVYGAKKAEERLLPGNFANARDLRASKHHTDTRSLPRFRPPGG